MRQVENDTSYHVGNAAGWASLKGIDATTADLDDESAWSELIPKTRLQPDTRHFFRISKDAPVTHVRLDVFPDGGLARLRVNGELTQDAARESVTRWLDLLPEAHAVQVLTAGGALTEVEAKELLGKRPFTGTSTLPDAIVQPFLG